MAAVDPVAQGQTFVDNMGQTLSRIALASAEAQSSFQESYRQTLEALAKMDPLEIDVTASISTGDDKGTLDFKQKLPAVVALLPKPRGVKQVTVKTHMDCSSSMSNAFHLDSEIDAKGKAGIGIGPFKAEVDITAHVGVSQDRKRASDMRASVDVEMLIGEDETPEIIARVSDAITDLVGTATDLQKSAVLASIAAKHAAQQPALQPGGEQPPAQT